MAFEASRRLKHFGDTKLSPGRPDWAIFHQLGYFWKLIVIFWKDEAAQSNSDILGYFLLGQIVLYFHLNKI
jgi:hypothetical protein